MKGECQICNVCGHKIWPMLTAYENQQGIGKVVIEKICKCNAPKLRTLSEFNEWCLKQENKDE